VGAVSQRFRRILISIYHDVRGGRAFVREFAATARRWKDGCLLQVRSPLEGLDILHQQGPWDGALIQIIDARGFAAAATAPCPVILIDPRDEVHPQLDRVVYDHGAAGRLAARHLLETGRRHFAVLGFEGAKVSELREAMVVAEMTRAGHDCPVLRIPVSFAHPRTRIGDESLGDLRELVRRVPRPGAVFCGNDELARALLEVAMNEGVQVPGELAILGADDDDLLCLTSTPTLSSVRVPHHVAGAAAARLLEKRILKKPANGRVVIPPVEVMMRDSTRVVPGEDHAVEEAMRRMHQGFADELRMADLAAAVGLSLSSLERRFRLALGVTPLQELRRLRLAEARRLLAETQLPVAKVAAQAGFRSATRFCIAFREDAGASPSDYRRLHQQGAPGR
jgi:LacI family transcriptional regulator